MEFAIRLSGSVEVGAAGRRAELGSTKSAVVLASLAWDAGRPVSVDTLVHRAWDDHPPAKAREALHVHISRIRAALGIAGSHAPAVVSRTGSYLLDVDPDRVDLRCYTDHVERARALRTGGGDDEAVLRLLDRAAGLWRGEPLAGIAGAWAEHLRATVAETVLGAAMTRAEILMDAGRFADAVPVLLPFLEEHPLDEGLAERSAVALYGSSRTAEATRLLQRTRQRIVRDIGLDAGRRLHRVHQGILAGTSAVALLRPGGAGSSEGGPPGSAVAGVPARSARLPGGAPSGSPAPAAPDNLPRDVPWVGRRDELRRLTSALRDSDGSAAVVTVEAIDGMGGVGKTSLAIHLGHMLRDRFPAGLLFLRLGGHASDRTALSPERALTELLRLTGLDCSRLPRELDELTELWHSVTRNRRMLVVLDDASGSAQVRPLLPGHSPTAVVVTSRRRLVGLPGVRPVSLDVLPPDDAVALFLQRLGARGRTSASEVAEIVRICGYLPLAVEIAASRLLARPSWSTADLLRQLTEGSGQLDVLRDGDRAMASVFALCYRELDAEQQLVFRRMGLHFGVEFGVHAVAALAGMSVDVVERVLSDLHTHHLISEPSPHRFTMHDLVREYARSLIENDDLTDGGDSRLAVGRMVDLYLGAADHADRLAYPYRARMSVAEGGLSGVSWPEMRDAYAAERWFLAEGANLLDVLEWLTRNGSEQQLATYVHVLVGFLDREGRHLVMAEPLLRRAVAHWSAVGDPAAQARALLDLGTMQCHGSRYEESVSAVERALKIAREIGDSELQVECVQQLSMSLWQTGQYAKVQKLQKDTFDLLLQIGSDLQIARSRNLLGITYLHLGKYQEALGSFQEALTSFTEAGNERGRFNTLNNIGEISRRMGDMATAEQAYTEAIRVAEVWGSKSDRATLQMNLADFLDELGKPEESLVILEGVLPTLREVGDLRGETIAVNRIGRAHRAAGRREQALEHHRAALESARRIHAMGEVVDALLDLAQAEQDAGHVAQAVAYLEEGLAVSRAIGATAEADRAAQALVRLGVRSRARSKRRG
ncbi:SARP family transcriptional regulator [Streptomyces sp. V2]|uniref:AfsR/SARP family transcriptional regulator n=1 Tax=Streptomyces sp. V2 TaxID=1424099 RepID=UPI000D670D55|nr:tetratricopeptide repeat protein [Streptomyces sp. V2]PWG12389.1 SARP family transcriptional regulator [Streptomyces sp. V2]